MAWPDFADPNEAACPSQMPPFRDVNGAAADEPVLELEPSPAPPVPDPDKDLPRSTSSAMPDPSSPSVPRLKARVHGRLSPEECAQIDLNALEYRALRPEDYQEVVALHTEWFPVSYDEAFYNKSVRGEIFTLAAVHRHSNGNAASEGGSSGSNSGDPGGDVIATGLGDCDLLGIVTMSTNCEHHADDIMSVLGSDCATTCRTKHPKDGGSMANEGADSGNGGALAYILTLGVVDGFRRRGLAKELLRRSIQHADRHMLEVQAVYLHVVTYNEAAIQLYESMRFVRLDRFNNFYNLHGAPYDSFLYARNLHQGRFPWKFRLRKLLAFSLTEWVMSTWSSMWSNDALERRPSEDSDTMTPP